MMQQPSIPHAVTLAAILAEQSIDERRAHCLWCWKRNHSEAGSTPGPEVDTICPECEVEMIAQGDQRRAQRSARKATTA